MQPSSMLILANIRTTKLRFKIGCITFQSVTIQTLFSLFIHCKLSYECYVCTVHTTMLSFSWPLNIVDYAMSLVHSCYGRSFMYRVLDVTIRISLMLHAAIWVWLVYYEGGQWHYCSEQRLALEYWFNANHI